MIKRKLSDRRNSLRISQEQMAFELNMSQSQYSRRENGITKILNKEWEKMAEILGTSIKEIYEPNEGIIEVMSDTPIGSMDDRDNLPDFLLETMKKYIKKLEFENEELKKENSQLKKKEKG
ncbi:helix-turn-helix transcriptional regulator [Poritiphilus flavus]|uniref:Helix-turn-helix domain-containing protein n=1 Tax=Poritiphilus flavus TaxID=2697053 RepID=A0A6L9EE43_9FLAO|nr:helix-turn-helix transcriptional regulator [Poritiphilus flavus]NAS13000.1 helix-turn-helix domain-containing protein [Poritiphilus flavus]